MALAETFERIAGLVDRLARRLEHTLGADDTDDGSENRATGDDTESNVVVR